MNFTLFYKSYDFKMSLKAMKMFKEATGKDLWSTLTYLIHVFTESRASNDGILLTMKRLADACDFDTAAQAFYCMAKQENSRLTLDEIEDAMFHCGWLPSQEEGEKQEPYPIVLYKVAIDVDQYMRELSSKKKPLAGS